MYGRFAREAELLLLATDAAVSMREGPTSDAVAADAETAGHHFRELGRLSTEVRVLGGEAIHAAALRFINACMDYMGHGTDETQDAASKKLAELSALMHNDATSLVPPG
ncbi:hypothetical protein GCM10010166_41280 [Couchioplanes caeruleus subsp. azureus]|nr:hypothetical protein GCM10010166_41280 [Couchioplanes caeruleus subsp. azureus]